MIAKFGHSMMFLYDLIQKKIDFTVRYRVKVSSWKNGGQRNPFLVFGILPKFEYFLKAVIWRLRKNSNKYHTVKRSFPFLSLPFFDIMTWGVFLNTHFLGRWTIRNGPIPLPSHSHDLAIFHFILRISFKTQFLKALMTDLEDLRYRYFAAFV